MEIRTYQSHEGKNYNCILLFLPPHFRRKYYKHLRKAYPLLPGLPALPRFMYDMAIELHTDGSRRLYEQIYDYIKTEIRDGKLLAGERLPSTRSLAEYLQVARRRPQ